MLLGDRDTKGRASRPWGRQLVIGSAEGPCSHLILHQSVNCAHAWCLQTVTVTNVLWMDSND